MQRFHGTETPAQAAAGKRWPGLARQALSAGVALTLLGCNYQASAQQSGQSASEAAPAVVVAPPAPAASTLQAPPLVTGLPNFAPLVERVGPSVVNIRAMEKVRSARSGAVPGSPEAQMEELLRRFFGIEIPNMPRGGGGAQPAPDSGRERQAGIGSGFIISPDGYIMTNAHVVEGADNLIVTLPDKREFSAKVVGQDKRTDVAVVKIDGTGLPAVQIGNVEQLRVGDWVLAIGSPFGLENSVTAGIVSAKQRDTGDYLPFIQTDVAINPGNSGGPLINMAGQVVGINSQIYSRSGGFMGISFSIPIDEAMRIADQLRQTGTVTRGRIGVMIGDVDREVASSLGLPANQQGALVRNVEADSPAAKAGVQQGDIITRFDGKTIEKTADLPRLVGETKPGTRASITVLRNGSTQDLTLTVEKAEEAGTPRGLLGGAEPKADSAATAVAALGMSVSELTSAQRQQLRGRPGVAVSSVTDGGPAARTGLRAGDLILSVGRQSVDSVESFSRAVSALPQNHPVSVLYVRDGYAQYGMIRPQAR
ncbi:DegQ family serine endoprotease [Brachymonas sp. G13]|uniref:DegQ family serine endoprotease n=1 Tax=Brachymonas TaxID=28219 RepID=UPI002E75B523|nr:DegQ family serine endoprotease [Brachymonas sp. J145]MEE1653026.1 DegQ family serine endoprotease [Brachymonas sp. J145]